MAYAPRVTRGDWLTFLALDTRLAGVVRQAREPMLAQLKLAWWRDRLKAHPAVWPKGEPLLARLSNWEDRSGLIALVDGWEALLGETEVSDGFAEGRVAGIIALAQRFGADGASVAQAARRWALADLGLHLGDPAELSSLRELLGAMRTTPLPRAMRPLAVLAGVTGRAFERGGLAALHTPGAFATAVRIGLVGR